MATTPHLELMGLADFVDLAARGLEGAGVVVIVGGVAVILARWGVRAALGRAPDDWYTRLRQGIGRAILLGLELLVGADIIRTTAEVPNLRGVAVLAGIVLIRTFLSFTLEVELEGRWPWQKRLERSS